MDGIGQLEVHDGGEMPWRPAGGEPPDASAHGRPAVALVPAQESSRERLIAAGVIRPAVRPMDVSAWHASELPDADPSDTVVEQLRTRR